MPTYALLGATGSTGSAIIRSLLSSPPEDLELNVFVRSKSKLAKAFPELENTKIFKTNIIEGVPSDGAAMQQCLKNTDAIFACIGTNVSTPGISIAYDTGSAIIDSLTVHRKAQGKAYKTPTVIQLRSASMNPPLKAQIPWIGQSAAWFCFRYVYEDLERACDLFTTSTTKSPGLLEYVWVDPPSIHDPDGTTPTGYKLLADDGATKQEPALSYADLGAAFCEIAERRDEFAGKAVGVSATGPVKQTMGVLMGYMASGIKGRIWG